MADTKIRASKATDVLKEGHEKVEKLFADYQDLKDGAELEKCTLFIRIQHELTIHATIEEEIFYPALAVVSKGKRDGAFIVAQAREAHKVVRTLLEELVGLDPSVEAFDAKMRVLQENVERHVEEEEDEMFPLFRELDEDEQDRVSEKLSARASELSREAPETPDE